jgi:hypothetical protein
MKFLNLSNLWVIFALLDPDTDSEAGSTDLFESGSNPAPAPKHCTQQIENTCNWKAESDLCWPEPLSRPPSASPSSPG